MTGEQLAWRIRRHGVEMTHLSGSSHIGAILSVADILGVLYARVLRFRPEEPAWADRDRFVLSKGHAVAALYAALAECGFFPVEELLTHCAQGSRLCGHASYGVPGVEFSTGSLGHGLPVAVGMALAAKQDRKQHRIFAVLGDGECNEGSVWEAAQIAAHFGLNNLTAVIDCNAMQSLDFCDKTLHSGDMAPKWAAFGWEVREVDGHDCAALEAALKPSTTGKPLVVIARTVKGKGVGFMEQDILWHYRFPHSGWEYDGAVTALHAHKPVGVADPYTPEGIACPVQPEADADIYRDHTLSATYAPTWLGR